MTYDRRSHQPTLLRVWRKYRNLTQGALAELSNTTTPTISRLENGRMGYTQHMLERIADALSCYPADIISRHPGETHLGEATGEVQRILERMGKEERDQAVRVLKAMFPIQKILP